MVLDAANITNTSILTRQEREGAAGPSAETNVNNDGIPEAGQTSEIGPAVVPNISAATLETSRAINAPEQTAAQAKATDIIEAEGKGQLDKKNTVKSVGVDIVV